MAGMIVVGVEESERSADALALARRLADATGAELLLVNAYPYEAVPGGPARPEYEEYVRRTAQEVLEHAGAFLQLYREEGWYLERTVHYIHRVGLDHVKKKVLDDAVNRKALWDRLQSALEGEPDPWFEFDKAGVDARQFGKLDMVKA